MARTMNARARTSAATSAIQSTDARDGRSDPSPNLGLDEERNVGSLNEALQEKDREKHLMRFSFIDQPLLRVRSSASLLDAEEL